MAQRSFPAAPPNPSTPLVPVPSHATPAAPSSIISRTQKFIEDNQKLLILGAAVAVGAGAGYYLYNRPSPRDGSSGSGSGTAGTAGSSKKSKNKKKKKSGADKDKFLAGSGLEGALLEEIEPKPKVEPAAPAPAQSNHLDGASEERLPGEES